MIPQELPPPFDAREEVQALIDTLIRTEQRLEELTAGEVDTVTDRGGRTFMLRRAQDHMRLNEAAKRAAIVDALPAHIALLDNRGVILSVNDAWRRFAGTNVLLSPESGIGVNYLGVCDSACGTGPEEARPVAEGIRSVLAGAAPSYAIEYPCNSPTVRRWFHMTVTPMTEDGLHGAVVMHLDITEQKQAEESLRESKNLLQLVVESVPSRIFWKDRSLRYLGCNTAFALDAGRSSPGELTGRTDFEMAWKDQAELYRSDDRAVMASGMSKLDFDEPQTRPDGKLTWIRTSKVPLRDREDKVIGILGLFEDITERRRKALALRESERRFSQFLGNVELIAMMLDRDGRVTYCNDFLLRLTGWQREEVIGRSWMELFVPPERAADLHEFFAALLADKPESWHHENEILTRTGERRLVRWSNSVLHSGDGNVTGTASLGEDITLREQSIRALRAAEEKFHGLAGQSLTGIYILQQGKFVYVNSRAAEIVGHGSGEELVGTDPLQWIVDADRNTIEEWLRKLLGHELHSVAQEFGLTRDDGAVIQIAATAAMATHLGQPAIIGLLQDISARKRTEDDILRYVEQLKTAFMSTVEVATILSELRDPYTAGHERRVAEVAVAIGVELGLDAGMQEGLRVAGHLHDVGKISIPSEILSKPGKLSAVEYQLIQTHPQAGYDVLKGVEFPWPVAQVALQHHERMDGSGYPQGLKGEAILFEARIMAVADVVEAMSSHRPYRPGLGIDRALAEIERGRGTAYDPVVADACVKMFREGRFTLPM